MSARLKLRRSSGRLRHFLDGKPVPTGAMLELMLSDGRWLRGRFVDVRTRPPMLVISIGFVEGDVPDEPAEAVVQLPPVAVLRWPEPEALDQES